MDTEQPTKSNENQSRPLWRKIVENRSLEPFTWVLAVISFIVSVLRDLYSAKFVGVVTFGLCLFLIFLIILNILKKTSTFKKISVGLAVMILGGLALLPSSIGAELFELLKLSQGEDPKNRPIPPAQPSKGQPPTSPPEDPPSERVMGSESKIFASEDGYILEESFQSVLYFNSNGKYAGLRLGFMDSQGKNLTNYKRIHFDVEVSSTLEVETLACLKDIDGEFACVPFSSTSSRSYVLLNSFSGVNLGQIVSISLEGKVVGSNSHEAVDIMLHGVSLQ